MRIIENGIVTLAASQAYACPAPVSRNRGLCASTMLGATVHADTATNTATDAARAPLDQDNDGDENLEEVQVTGVRSLLRDKLGDTPLNTPQRRDGHHR
ncbi:MAG: hypothetical protein WDM77_17770 [Steroidobacteraceae bacterium]